MKIATWNLDHASNSSRPIQLQIEQLIRVNGDILVLTETCEKVDLRYQGFNKVVPHKKNRYSKYWSTIWTKWPVIRQIDCYDNETAVCALIAAPTGDLIVYGTIITWRNDPGLDPNKKAPSWSEHDKSIFDHGADWKMIQDKFPGIPFIVAGDFNQTRDGSRAYCSPNGIQLLNDQLDMNFMISATDQDYGAMNLLNPDPNPKKKGRYRHNVDHICISKSLFKIECVGAWDHFTEKAELSDHNGVFVELSFVVPDVRNH